MARIGQSAYMQLRRVLVIMFFSIIIVCNLVLYDVYCFLGLWYYNLGGLSKKALNVQDDSRCKGIQGNTSKSEIKCVCLNARSINK